MQWDIVPEVLSTLIVIIMLANSRSGNAVPSTRDKIFRFSLYYTIFCTALNVFSTHTVAQAQTIPLWVNMVVNTAYFTLYPLLPLIFIMYLLLYVYDLAPFEHRYRLRLFTAILVTSMVIFIIFALTNINTGWIFRFDASGTYIRGPLNRLSLVVASFQIITALSAIWVEREHLDRTFFQVILWLPFLSLGIITLQFIFPDILEIFDFWN